MLSILNQLTSQFEQTNGYRANLLFINTIQLEQLKEQLSENDMGVVPLNRQNSLPKIVRL